MRAAALCDLAIDRQRKAPELPWTLRQALRDGVSLGVAVRLQGFSGLRGKVFSMNPLQHQGKAFQSPKPTPETL